MSPGRETATSTTAGVSFSSVKPLSTRDSAAANSFLLKPIDARSAPQRRQVGQLRGLAFWLSQPEFSAILLSAKHQLAALHLRQSTEDHDRRLLSGRACEQRPTDHVPR